MAVPDYETLMLPVLKLTADGIQRVPQMLPALQRMYSLSDADMQELLPSGRTSVAASRTHWARTYLVKAGLLERSTRGVCRVTAEGRRFLASNPERISNHDLDRFPGFVEWRTRRTDQSHDSSTSELLLPDSMASRDLSPEETMERAFSEVESELADDVLARVRLVAPGKFEQLIVDLLMAMGYGRGMVGAGRAIGRSGDGGIDGVIDEDALGLDAVYIQAKRYGADNRVGRPAIQQFVGSLHGVGATKGVFVTTSDFSAEARDYARHVAQRIILIDGQQLARLMIANEVGVRARQTYVLRTIDEDVFTEG